MKCEILQDCPDESLNRFDKVPKPIELGRRYGIHPKICCPEYLSPNASCLPSDPWCPTYKLPDYGDEYDWTPPAQIKVSDDSCNPYGQFATLPGIGTLTECVAISKCYNLLNATDAPLSRTITCGFDEELNLMKICCPPEMVTEPQEVTVAPRFPKNGVSRPVEDRAKPKFCKRWKENDGCKLDRDVIISEVDPINGIVYSFEMFEFMIESCLDTCGWATERVKQRS